MNAWTRRLKPWAFAASIAGVCGLVYHREQDPAELANRIPEAAPYLTDEAQFFAPPFEEYWKTVDNPGQCQSCHKRIFDEWKGSMMANAWRDPVWRGAFLLSARETSTNGDCGVPPPPDGTARAHHNPFANEGQCSSSFDLGSGRHTLSRPGSLLDGFCARCHMPSNYVDNVPLQNVARDRPSGLEHGRLDPNFDPTSDNGTGLAFATLESQLRNTESGKSGVFCAICHSIAGSRDTPYHSLARSGRPSRAEYVPVLGSQARGALLPPPQRDVLEVPDEGSPNLGYGIGAGSFRLSPHAIAFPERFGPLAASGGSGADRYLEGVFRRPMPYEQVDASKHLGYRHVLLTRAELCSACHDVTNPLTIKNRLGQWAGGFPIERTYSEWLRSRYADRPGNANYDRRFKRDCQTCHMQQDYGQPGTAQTLYVDGAPRDALRDKVADDSAERPYFTHHFVGGNSYIPHMIGASTSSTGAVESYPQLSAFSFSSADEESPYARAYWTGVPKRGPIVQQARLAWDRLRHVLDLELRGPQRASAGERVPLAIRVANSGSGHKFPTGFPEGRTAWLAVHAYDLATGRELPLYDSFWKRTAVGVGGLTDHAMVDPSFPEKCHWRLPAGSADPHALQFKAVASLGDGCPTLDLVYAHPLNMVVDAHGQPLDAQGRVIDRSSPQGVPQLKDLDGDGDVFDDAYLRDTRLDPMPLAGSSVRVDRYSVVVPPGTAGPIAVSAAVYYQSVEAVVAEKFLGNLADTDMDRRLEPCVLGGACDGRVPSVEPPVVEGAPPVPMEVRSWVIALGETDAPRPAPAVVVYPKPEAADVFQDVVVKAAFSEPVHGVDAASFTLEDSHGARVPAEVDQVGDGTWALFPRDVFLRGNETYTARLAAGVCGFDSVCTKTPLVWRFRTNRVRGEGSGDTRIGAGFGTRTAPPPLPPRVTAARLEAGGLVVAFSEPVMNVTSGTLSVAAVGPQGCVSGAPLPGRLAPNAAADVWTYVPDKGRGAAAYCLRVSTAVYNLAGQSLSQSFTGVVSEREGTRRPGPSSDPQTRAPSHQRHTSN